MTPRFFENSKGSLQAPLIAMMMIAVLGGFGSWGVFRHWRFLVETQLRLNQCVGTEALEFKKVLNELQRANEKITLLRASIQISILQPELIPPLKSALLALVVFQDYLCSQWELRRWKWVASGGCGQKGDQAMPLPKLDVKREPPDLMGHQCLNWVGDMPNGFKFHARHPPRAISARVEGGTLEGIDAAREWKAHWTW